MSSLIQSTGMMEPMRITTSSKHYSKLADLAVILIKESTAFTKSLPDVIIPQLAHLIRSMNCYYSNLIEGHNTHPIDIEKALKNDYSEDPQKRNLQLEAKAHILVQKWIDETMSKTIPIVTCDNIIQIHKRFYENVPPELLLVENPQTDTHHTVIAGALRTEDVRVGKHIAIEAKLLPDFMHRFQEAYTNLGELDSVLAVAAAHHRFLWIHPFLDGNGRVARLLSHAMLLSALDTNGLWSVSRALAKKEKEYKQYLALCDLDRRNDLDGRGTLSEESLAEFTQFFLARCIDQVRFMQELFVPQTLNERIMLWAKEAIALKKIPYKSDLVLEALLYRGQVMRSDVLQITNTSESQARRITSALLKAGIITSQNLRMPLQLACPASLAHRWFPNLFPDKVSE